MLRAFGHRVAMCCDMLAVVGSSMKLVKLEPTTPNMSQHGGQTQATCCTQQCCDMLSWHVAIVWPGLYLTNAKVLRVEQARADIIHSNRRIKEIFDPEKLTFSINSEHKSA